MEEYYDGEGRVFKYQNRKQSDMGPRLAYAGKVFDRWKTRVQRRESDGHRHRVNRKNADPQNHNLFGGKFPSEHLEPPYELSEAQLERIKPILDHCDEVICGSNKEMSEYPWNWFAYLVQDVGFKKCVPS